MVFFVSTISYAFIKRTPTDTTDILGKAREKQYENSADKPWFIDTTTTDTTDQSGNLLLQENGASLNSGSTTSTTINIDNKGTATTGSTGTTSTTTTTSTKEK